MNRSIRQALTLAVMTLGVFCARSQTAYNDTLHITPAMIDSIRANSRIEPFEREIEQNVFIPKGQWITGVSISYSQSNQDKYQFFVVENLNADTYRFKVSPMFAYAFANDMAAGIKFSYERSLLKMGNMDFVLGEDTQFNVDHVYSLSHNYYVTGLFRNYFALGNSKRFGFFNEVQVQIGGGQSKLTKGISENLTGTFERNFSLDIGLTPGLMVFLTNYSAMEVNIGVLGFSYRKTTSVRDQIYNSSRHSKSANFKINLFSITFGTTFYL